MSEQLLEFLQESLASHGMKADRSGAAVHAQDGLVIEPRVFPRDSVGGTVQVQVDFAIESPRLPGIRFLDSFGGVAAGPHWMRVFWGVLDGKHTASEVLVDGEVSPAGQALLDAHAFTCPPGYASFRHLLIALPQDA